MPPLSRGKAAAHGGPRLEGAMTQLTPLRARLAILALALGGFSIGTTEFIAMGLLPEIARDLLPDLYATDSEGAVAKAGWLITAYAIGVVVGAPPSLQPPHAFHGAPSSSGLPWGSLWARSRPPRHRPSSLWSPPASSQA